MCAKLSKNYLFIWNFHNYFPRVFFRQKMLRKNYPKLLARINIRQNGTKMSYQKFVDRMADLAYEDPLSRTRMNSKSIENVLYRRTLDQNLDKPDRTLIWDKLPYKEIDINKTKYVNIKTLLGQGMTYYPNWKMLADL